jgi:hypothetical protein
MLRGFPFGNIVPLSGSDPKPKPIPSEVAEEYSSAVGANKKEIHHGKCLH